MLYEVITAVFLDIERPLIAAPAAELAARLDERASTWLAELPRGFSPRDVPPLPVFGYPGWSPGTDDSAFYADERYFRPYRGERDAAPLATG